MEKAILINRVEDFKHLNKRYSRIYLGNEFCPRLLPLKKELKEIIDIVRKSKFNFTFLTSQLDSIGFKNVERIVRQLDKEQLLEEIVVNDYGLLYYIRKNFPDCQIILGRMLSRFLTLYKESFFRQIGIKRLEFDNLKEIKRDGADKISYYYPYSLFFVTRYCPVASINKNKSKNHGIINCSKECLKIGRLSVDGNIFTKTAILKGNAQFMKNRVVFESLAKKGVDRLIFQPHVPL